MVTVFSCPNYCGNCENEGAWVTLEFKEAGKISGLGVGHFKGYEGE